MKIDLQPLICFFGNLPKGGNEELALLKAHLVIEEVLTKIIEDRVKHPEQLRKGRLRFAQKMYLARSLADLEHQSWAWGATKTLNDARNELAHGLSKNEIEEKISQFVELVESAQGQPDDESISPSFGRLHWALFKVFVVFSTYAHLDLSHLKVSTVLTNAEQAVAVDRPKSDAG